MVQADGIVGLLDGDDSITNVAGCLDSLNGAVSFMPRHPMMRALGRLDQFAGPPGPIPAADHQTLAQEGVAQPEERANVLALAHPVEDHLDRQAPERLKYVSVLFVMTQLSRCQRLASSAGRFDGQLIKRVMNWTTGLQRSAPTKAHHLPTSRRQIWSCPIRA